MTDIDSVIAEQRNNLKTDRLDMSFGELMNIFEDGDLFIAPEYQRAFRWSNFQQTRFIESVLLGIPIPPIFVAEDNDGKWEIVDGLQRISTIFAFFGVLEALPNKNNSTLTEGEIVKELEGLTIKTLSIKLKTTIRRTVCRVEIVRWDSNQDMRYELFNRLNTGASPLSEQEIRNCIFRSYPVDLNQILRDIAQEEDFIELISPTNTKKEQMFLEELALRYFAFKYLKGEFKTTVPQFLTEFMLKISNNKQKFDFDLDVEKNEFIERWRYLLVHRVVEDIIESNSWRDGEFAQFKINRAGVEETLWCRMCIPMIYAHWEGFVVSSLKILIKHLNDLELTPYQIPTNLVVMGLGDKYQSLSGKQSFAQRIVFTDNFKVLMQNNIKFPNKVNPY